MVTLLKGNINKLMKQAQKMQAQLLKAQDELAGKTVEATSGGGAVRVVVSGGLVVKEIKIDREAVDPEDVEMLEDLVLTAVNEAIKKAQEMTATEMGKITGGLGIPGMGDIL
jgi:DNA-binding YbaB/EbfC family protein